MQPEPGRTLIVVNHFDRRSTDNLYQLLASMEDHPAGTPFDLCVVVNQTQPDPVALRHKLIRFLHYRENSGMNIGAWDHGWRSHPEYGYYLFLQDECVVHRDGWLRAAVDRLQDQAVGLVGESINSKWDRPWPELAIRHDDRLMPGHVLDGQPVGRVQVYLQFMRRRGIDPGTGGRHVQSLVWALRGDTLPSIDGFPIGNNYGECIAAEIAVSRKIESMGLGIEQLERTPFAYIRHTQWGSRRNRSSRPATLLQRWFRKRN